MRRKLLLGATIVAQLLSPRARAERAMTGSIIALMVGDALAAPRGVTRSIVVGGIGHASELVGVATGRPFGHYSYTAKLGPGAGGVPFAVAGCWAMLAHPSWAAATAITSDRALRPLVAAGAMTAWDVAVDPRMVREGWWTWPQGGRYEGIPASNFLGWLVVGTAAFAVWSLLEPDPEPDPEGVVLYAWSWLGEVVANLLFWRRPRVALAAGLAMGPFAVRALGALRR